ncbi:hypothetical protein ENH_00004710 [Eimeria necatrix]|uniref:Uncharacterized protein n=1 Tax=Eimeria necatrix TaxID=51315 RepID=U6MSG0_9EIME|nr:hypothetical protein ENH_00004710 [Eimeria necatrix]CDJ65419.1 hypothetical protein ENH_00004710 [Eimeria necatrix]
MQPIGNRKMKLGLEETPGTATIVRVVGTLHEFAPAKGNEPSGQARPARSVEVLDTMLVTVLHNDQGRAEPKKKSSGQPIRPSTEKTKRLNREA